jgi:hypothetical protein
MHVRFRRKPVSRLSSFRVVTLICFFALPSSVVAYQAVAASQQAGSISGHIFTDAAHPVQGAAITLLNSQTAIHKVAYSDASGAYVFSSLPAGQYQLLAFHPGYFAEYFNMVPQKGNLIESSKMLRGAHHSFIQGVVLRPDQPTATADFKLTPSPSIKALRDEALSASYSAKERAQLSFSSGTFSPDVRYLALQSKNVVSGDPEQVWRYELGTGQLVAVTPTPTVADSPQIRTLHWAGDSLQVTGEDRWGGRHFQAELPAHGSSSITYTQQPSPWPQAENLIVSAGRYTLTATVLHGGSTTWAARLDGSGPHKVIASALLNAPIVNAAVPFFFYVPVTYPTTFIDDSVAAFDLRTGHQTTQRLPVSTGLRLLAVAPDASGFLLAYQVMGGCEPTFNQDGEASDQLNGFGGLPLQRQAAHVCFVHLHSPR